MMDGTRYTNHVSVPIRRHVTELEADIAKDKCRVFALLSRLDVEPTKSTITNYSGVDSTIYTSQNAEEGSRVNNIHFDLLIKPKTASDAAVIPFYTAWVQCSFHDIKSGEVRGLSLDNKENPQFNNDAKNTAQNIAPVGFGVELDFDIVKLKSTPSLLHWWRGISKQGLQAGQAVNSVRKLYVPSKCKRMNRGTFWGFVVMNESDDTLTVELKTQFNELPLADIS